LRPEKRRSYLVLGLWLIVIHEMLSSSAAMGMGGYHQHQQQPQQRGAGPVFTAAQWAELEQQALIYKYLMAHPAPLRRR
jgi:hypothetical protein